MRAYIFDFNGVLWWDTFLQEKAWDEIAIKIRGRAFSNEEKFNHLHGRQNKDILEYLSGKKIGKKEIMKLATEKEEAYRKLCLAEGENFKLSPGAENLLQKLKDANIPRTIATSSEKGNVDFFVKYLHLANWFDTDRILYDDGSFLGKPAPDIYLRACEILNVDPKDAVVIEDSKSGLEAAVAAGIGRVIALGPESKKEELTSLPGVDGFIENLGQLKVEI